MFRDKQALSRRHVDKNGDLRMRRRKKQLPCQSETDDPTVPEKHPSMLPQITALHLLHPPRASSCYTFHRHKSGWRVMKQHDPTACGRERRVAIADGKMSCTATPNTSKSSTVPRAVSLTAVSTFVFTPGAERIPCDGTLSRWF